MKWGGGWLFGRPLNLLWCFGGNPPLAFHQVLCKSVEVQVFYLLLQNCSFQYGWHNNIWKLPKIAFQILHSISFPKMCIFSHPQRNLTSVMLRTTTAQTICSGLFNLNCTSLQANVIPSTTSLTISGNVNWRKIVIHFLFPFYVYYHCAKFHTYAP